MHVLKFGEFYESYQSPIPEELRQEEGIEMALDAMRKASASEEVREMIEFRKKGQRDEATRLERAQKQGLEMGLERGREEGREEGLERGRQQALKETARRMREAGMVPEDICRITGLRLDELDDGC